MLVQYFCCPETNGIALYARILRTSFLCCSLFKVKCVETISANKKRSEAETSSFAKQFSCMFHHISMLSLCLPWLPQIWKWAMVKKNPPMALHSLGLLARTSLLMKSMEKLIKKETVLQVENCWILF